MRLVVALGGNALLRRNQAQTAANQLANVRIAAEQMARIALAHSLVVTHGNGPQVGLLALQAEAYKAVSPYPLDVLGAQTEGMIGYLLEQELSNRLPPDRAVTTLLSRVEVDGKDPAFAHPTKPIGPVYTAEEARIVRAEHLWSMVAEAKGGLRRVVPSPLPQRILGLAAIRALVDAGICVICAGGGGIPVIRNDAGGMGRGPLAHGAGLEAVGRVPGHDRTVLAQAIAFNNGTTGFLQPEFGHGTLHRRAAPGRHQQAAPVHLAKIGVVGQAIEQGVDRRKEMNLVFGQFGQHGREVARIGNQNQLAANAH